MEIAENTLLGERYRVAKLLGQGGMGAVYLAHDVRFRDSPVAVKQTLVGHDRGDLRKAFQREAMLLYHLRHPLLPRVIDFFGHGDAEFLVMEFVPGEDLATLLGQRGTPYPVEQVMPWAHSLLDVLSYLHSFNPPVIHRDIKPQNMKLTPDGDVVLLDFGLAKGAVGLDSGTTASVVAATRHFAPPEQLNGQGTSTQSDLYSLAATLYSLLTARLPADASHRSNCQINGQADPLVPAHDVNPSIPAAVSAVLLQAMQLATSARPQSAAAMQHALLEALEMRAVEPGATRGTGGRDAAVPSDDERAQSTVEAGSALPMAVSQLRGQAPAGGAVHAPDASRLRESPDALSLEGNAQWSAPSGAAKGLKPWHAVSVGFAALLLCVVGALLLAAAFAVKTWMAARPQTSAAPNAAAAFQQVTFREGALHSARFAPDGQTIVYSAAWEGQPTNLFLVRPGSPETRSLAMPETNVLAISHSGEMAVLREGTLSRVALTGGSPRAIVEDVEGADWAPGRDDLAVVHWTDGKFRLEYPIGTVRYESNTVLTSPRFSPDGRHIAFCNHPIKGDDRGSILVATLDGETRVISEGWSSLGGLAWSPTGNEIWFAGARSGANRSMHAVSLDGVSRLISSVAGSLYLLDVTPDGRALVAQESRRMEILARTRGESSDRKLAWLDGSIADDISADGKMLLFSELNHGGGTNYSSYIRKTDGSPATRLGDGRGAGLSPDGRFALSVLPTSPPQLVLLPTGAGESRVLIPSGLDQIATARWFPDGRRVVVVGQEAGKPWRSFVVDTATSAMSPLTRENIKGHLVTPDGRYLVAHDGGQNEWILFALDGGAQLPIKGLDNAERPIRWSEDGQSLYIREATFPVRIFRLNPTTGSRELVAELKPAGLVGMKPYPRSVVITPDGRTYAYTVQQVLSALFVVEGVLTAP